MGGFSPLDLQGLAAWYRSASLSFDRVADGQTVATWRDESGNGRHLTQATEANKPLLKTNVVNGLHGVRFDGVNDVLQTVYSQSQPFTLAVVGRSRLADIIGNRTWVAGGGVGNAGIFAEEGGTDFLAMYAGLNIGLANLDTLAHCVVGVFNGASSLGTFDGGAPITGDVGAQAATNVNVGGLDASQFHDGDIAEVILYSRALSTAERQQVERFLMTKYGIRA